MSSAAPFVNPIRFDAAAPVAAAIAALGRTEDVAFSPARRRLAIASYGRNACLVLDLRVSARAIDGFVEIVSFAISQPHGLTFLDECTLAVANRGGKVCLFALPERGANTRANLAPLQTIHGSLRERVRTPGSLVARDLGRGLHELMVCNNYVHRVTRHVLDARARYHPRRNSTLLAKRLATPDGIDISPDGRWIAVSNHLTQSVLLYENTAELGRESEPAGTLTDIDYPHGVRFSADGRTVFVADAGGPTIHAFARAGDDWRGATHGHTVRTVMTDQTFRDGNVNPQEGGPKGISLDCGHSLLVTTSEFQPLAFFDLRQWSPAQA